ncbi:alpha-1,3-glucan synthase-like protein [Lasiosphaeria miniovina]|uniref:alpha-1,3-glucan synthase n=1 Tax=Lasiosphaeria miniovina TaxID=1954250 RepID=A0AA40AAR8_9PEZI|nr:alpha-1,3-glucan synthase-like protein [Lasiosphaeria miniovina]KAK0712424.1 alpha-1,3-glucan synthase-like protein [Lasiosphaeria miniovina]
MTLLALLSTRLLFTLVATTTTLVNGLKYDSEFLDYNLNTNQSATDPLNYWGSRDVGFEYQTSPDNWRVPFYTIFIDRFVNGDPENDDINGTVFEADMMSTQLRFGGDLSGLTDSLDYIAGMGIKALYIAGSPFINQPWGADSYSPLDLTLLDKHFGSILTWQTAIDEIHKRGMYVVMDNTMATMGDLIGFEGHLNESTPFQESEHRVQWKTDRQYLDFDIGNDYNNTCKYPEFWFEDGTVIKPDGLNGCYNSDFDQYGDIEAFGVYPDWKRQLAKFASVQDRLREWEPSVLARLERFSCMTIAMLDIDGFRIDKAVQVTVDAQAHWSSAMRDCAVKHNKTNFMIVGEITAGNTLGSIYLGRGRVPSVAEALDMKTAMTLPVNTTDADKYFVRENKNSALDAGAFHYSVYRYMARFLGMSGNLKAGYDLPTDWVKTWETMITTNDFFNANNGNFDPRHLYGSSNQDVFRWPTIQLGTERMLLAYFITSLLLPGAPLVYYGEEQGLYVLDGTAENYVFGRQSFAPSPAWKAHGCFSLVNDLYVDWPLGKGADGCHDEAVGWDHRDPSAPVRNIFKRMFALREDYPVLEHGWLLEQLSNQTRFERLLGSPEDTEFGIWSVVRGMYSGVQTEKADPVWLVYHNQQNRTTYTFDCSDESSAFYAPFSSDVKVRNLFSSDAAIGLTASTKSNGFTGDKKAGCLSSITMEPFEFRAYVPDPSWVEPAPMITKFTPGHDFPIDSTNANGKINITIEFNTPMNCDAVKKAFSVLQFVDGTNPNGTSVGFESSCPKFTGGDKISFTGAIQSAWVFQATLLNVGEGIVKLTVNNATSANNVTTDAVDHFLLRFGRPNNPVVFPGTGNYSRSLLVVEGNAMYAQHDAPGATLWRYSTNWGTIWSKWVPYSSSKTKVLITEQSWEGTALQSWTGKHLMVQYYSKPLGSSAFMQHSDTPDILFEREFPHIKIHGPYNKWGYDAGLPGAMTIIDHHKWALHFMYEWPATFQLNIWGINPDNQPDAGAIYGDIDGDGIVDRLPPSSLANNVINITSPPPMPALAYRLIYNDATWRYNYEPVGSIWIQIIIFALLAILPLLFGCMALWIYFRSFYQVKINKSGFSTKGWRPLKLGNMSKLDMKGTGRGVEMSAITPPPPPSAALGPFGENGGRRTVLIATMEYNMEDFGIKIKIGGLGVMAQLMADALSHLDLVWVVPMVGDIQYPTDRMEQAESMFVDIMGQPYEIVVYYHVYKNITYVILDAPIFRKQTKADPYIARMDDIESAILYGAWNSCIAESIRRFPVDIYHINDYHGAAAPLYLLPQTIPVCLSLHNAEFQGMWPMRTPEEAKEVCEVFNLSPEIVKDYVQYGSVFNLLHAGASYLRLHQRGFGAVGVSRKYGDRSLARYPIFWSLKNIGQLPNPDPSDTADWNPNEDISKQSKDIEINQSFEEKRGNLRRQAQEWAGLEVDPSAELFVFVGRWSLQKGVDLIADIFPSILDKYPKTQLICVGPVIDLYGRFAALKLEKLMHRYPRRVFSKPEFTQLPPYIFSGAEFALIPSRDEPFGLVAVEFGRKGALGVGARVGGLGQMPGFWYTVESMTPSHLLQQFRQAIVSALDCKSSKRALMRAWSAKQRFPVAQWVKQLDELHSQSIRIHQKEAKKMKLEVVSSLALTRPSSRASSASYIDQNHNSMLSPGLDTGRMSPASIAPPSRVGTPTIATVRSFASPTLPTPNAPWAGGSRSNSPRGSIASSINAPFYNHSTARDSTASVDSFAIRAQKDGISSPTLGPDGGLGFPRPAFMSHRNSSLLSLPDVVGDRHDLKLQQVDQFFTDTSGEYYAEFDELLENMTASNSVSELCVENFLKKSEKEWFGRYRDAKLGRNRDSSRPRSPGGSSRPVSRSSDRRNESIVSRGRQRHRSVTPSGLARSVFETSPPLNHIDDEFLLGDGYQAPTGVKKLLSSVRVGDWPLYSFFLALGQIISVNSYQIVLLSGETNQKPEKLYMVAGSYIAGSILWWIMERNLKSVYALSAAWFFFGLGFFLLGVAPFLEWHSRDNLFSVASCIYAVGASSGALSFALNFGDEGGAPTKQWITRALVVAGLAQVYSLLLWYWGSLVTNVDTTMTVYLTGTKIPQALAICVPVAVIFWIIGVVLLFGLPDFYRQSPAKIPGFYISLYRRKVVPWFFVMIIVQNYWLSAPYGRSWQFLFASQFIPGWGVFLMALGFFVIIWGLVLYGFSYFSDEHTWLLPIFAIGLLAPRWAQEFWGTSGLGWYIPWAGSPMGSAILSRLLWLWLGLLDNIQGVGLGMMLLATLTRQHVLIVLIMAQIIGSAFTILARATSPNALSPNTTFPDFSQGLYPGVSSQWFWVCLLFQLIIPVGFFKFFRKEQVAKP